MRLGCSARGCRWGSGRGPAVGGGWHAGYGRQHAVFAVARCTGPGCRALLGAGRHADAGVIGRCRGRATLLGDGVDARRANGGSLADRVDGAARDQARRRPGGEGDDADLIGDGDECEREMCFRPRLEVQNELSQKVQETLLEAHAQPRRRE